MLKLIFWFIGFSAVIGLILWNFRDMLSILAKYPKSFAVAFVAMVISLAFLMILFYS